MDRVLSYVWETFKWAVIVLLWIAAMLALQGILNPGQSAS